MIIIKNIEFFFGTTFEITSMLPFDILWANAELAVLGHGTCDPNSFGVLFFELASSLRSVKKFDVSTWVSF